MDNKISLHCPGYCYDSGPYDQSNCSVQPFEVVSTYVYNGK